MAVPARFTVITLGVADVGRAASFYERLGFTRKMKATGDEVAFFETGGTALALWSWDKAAKECGTPADPRPRAFRGIMLAWNCSTPPEVDAAMEQALASGAQLLKAAHATDYGGYAGYFADLDGHVWEIVTAPGISVQADGRVSLPA
jgi:predicted lactoylglutathione lyase